MTGQIHDTVRFADLGEGTGRPAADVASTHLPRRVEEELLFQGGRGSTPTGVYCITAIRNAGPGGEARDPLRHRPWEELFDPVQHGLAPVDRNSACRRGYVCHFTIANDRLYLDSLIVNLKEKPVSFLGILPSSSKYYSAEYHELHHPIGFTGEILAGRDFVDGLYIHMGFSPAWKFREVQHFIFAQGRLTDHRDRSKEAAEFRQQHPSYRGMGPIPDLFSLSWDPWAA